MPKPTFDPSPVRLLRLLCVTLILVAVATSAEARTRNFCPYEPFYGGKAVTCGGHLDPICTSGSACNSGHNRYSGSPFPITIDCPTINVGFGTIDIPDETVSAGCYDYRPTCNDCGGEGQPGCPVAAEPWCTRGCDPGLEPHPTTTICEVPGAPGSSCGPGFPCGAGLTCDPFEGFRCVAEAGVGDSCANPFVKCADELQCTLALVCSHDPAREGETCDVTAPCDNGLFCQPGIPQLCQAYRKPGEGCSVVNPCIEGSSCEACFTDSCHSLFQCFPNGNGGAITEQQCRVMYSPGDSILAEDAGLTLTYAAGDGIALVAGEAQSFGVAYGADGSYGCFTSLCYGVNLDVSIEAFISLGFYDEYMSVDGFSWVSFEEVSLPGDLVAFSTSQVFSRDDAADLTPGKLIGTEDAFAIGIGPNPFPVAAGVFLCETVLDTLIDGSSGGPPGLPPPPQSPGGNMIVNPEFDADLSGWHCENQGICNWIEDDPSFSTISGAGSVGSPVETQANPGRLTSSCVSVEPGETVLVDAWLRATGAKNGVLRGTWYANSDCSSSIVGSVVVGLPAPDGNWEEWSEELVVPFDAQSMTLSAEAYRDTQSGESSTLEIDAVFVPEPSRVLSALVAGAVLAVLARRRARASGGEGWA